MKQSFHKIAIAATMGALLSGNVYADADIAVQPAGTPTEATTNVDICVVVPEILIFGLGAVGDPVAKIIWSYAPASGTLGSNNLTYSGGPAPFTTPAPFSPALVDSIMDGGAFGGVGTAIASLPVFLFSNNGSDVTITVAVAGGTGGGTLDALDPVVAGAGTIPITDFTSGDGGAILHPTLTSGLSADTAETAGIVNLADTWTYEYTPTSIPVAGTYDARITYVASQP